MTAPANPRAGIGHNNGPTLESGASWRRYSWARARAELLPTLPVEVVRMRVRRAVELGLPYKTYAGIRASTGHDLIGFLFSSNALGLLREARLDAARQARISAIQGTERLALAHPPLAPEAVAQIEGVDGAFAAPPPHLSWSATRDALRAVLRARGHPADRVLLVGEPGFERDWAEAARMAGFLTGTEYFGRSAP